MIVATLTITIDDKGQVSVNGPVDQLMLCYGLLEIAKDSLRNHQASLAKRVQAPGIADVAAFGRKS